MEKDLDKKLYNDYLNEDNEAFEILYNKYKKRIEYFIFNIVKDYQKAEDLTQETFIYVMQSRIKTNCSFKYFLYLIAKSKAFNYLNVENRRNEIIEEFLANSINETENDVLETILKEENKAELLNAIEKLDEKYKNAVYLTSFEGLSYKETAEILGESVQNVKNLVHRGKNEIRKILLQKGFSNMNKVSKVCLILICSIVVVSGTVFAGIMIKNFFGQNSSDGVDKAVENNYIFSPNMEYQSAEGINVKVEDVLIDDYNFDMNFRVKLSNNYNIDDFMNINFYDMTVKDETGKMVFNTHIPAGKKIEDLEEYEYYLGSYSFLTRKASEDELIVSLSAAGNPVEFPKSKKLIVDLPILLPTYEINQTKVKGYEGKWHFEVDVPEKFYNREVSIFKAIKCNDDSIDLNSINATLSNTAFRISIPEIKSKKINYEALKGYDGISIYHMIAIQKEYVKTSSGKRFEASARSDGDGGYMADIDNARITDYFQTFNLTKFDASEKVEVHLPTNNDEEIIIEFARK